jgi:thiamine-monophosphate kinase
MPGEFDLIAWIAANSSRKSFPANLIELGVGDDLAVLNWPGNQLLLLGVDQVIDGVHFDSSIHSPRQIGTKAMNRNLSDCAAMACLPAAALAAVAFPKEMSLDAAKELYLGLREAADAFDCPIVGGDCATTPGRLTLAVTILGRSAGHRPITRNGAKPGDSIYVTGPLGGSILGRHMTFSPQIAIGQQLASIATAMIDISDGLSRDLGHICQGSGVGAVLQANAIPIHPDAVRLSAQDNIPPLQHALADGEDYELLFTAKGDCALGTKIGIIVAEPGIWLENAGSRQPLNSGGWEHRLEDKR